MSALHPFRRGCRMLASAVLLTLLLGLGAEAHDYKLGNLVINHPWTRATPRGAKVAGGYVSITNNSAESDRLLGGTFTGAERVEIHEMKMVDGVMRMRPLAGGLEIKPGETIKIEPNGFHLMFVGMSGQIREGDKPKGQLRFEKAGTIEVDYVVTPAGSSPAQPAHQH